MYLATKEELQKAARHLAKQDPILAPVIKQAGLAGFTPHRDYYSALVNSIIGQQLSVKAAATIKRRFRELFDGDLPSPEAILVKSVDELRTAGLSQAKVNYIRDLAQHIIDGKLDFKKLNMLSNEEIITKLTDVKGIGEWTAHMFLMFCVGHLDVLATGDLGIRNGIRNLYALPAAPTPDQVRNIAETNHWHPYESAACWYVWRSLDNAPNN